MALLNRTVFEAAVSLYGVRDYAQSGAQVRPMTARVELHKRADLDLDGRDPLALLIPLAASRMLSLARRKPEYVPAIMAAVEACANGLSYGDAEAARRFRVREAVETDIINLESQISILGKPAVAEAEVNSALPVVEEEPVGAAERTTRVFLMTRKMGTRRPWAMFKFPRRSGNPLITNAALFATLEHCARNASFEQATLPAAVGLTAVVDAWKGLDSPSGTSIAVSADMDALVVQAVLGKAAAV